MTQLLFKYGDDWSTNPGLLDRCFEAVEDIARNDLGLDIYPNKFVVIPSEDMLDAFASVGLPFMYQHWSFGQTFAQQQQQYRKTGSLAYELVINSNPCVSWNMASNTTTHMLLVMAHAAMGHNHFFKNNYLFKQWTNADGMEDYLRFARDYIHQCEERYGAERVETILDAAHALQFPCGVFRSHRPRQLNPRKEEARLKARLERMEKDFDPRWHDVVPHRHHEPSEEEQQREIMNLPEENVLYFLEKYAMNLKPYEREIIRIVRVLAQYFYPQGQTKVMNEGCATFVHKYITDELGRQGRLDNATILDIFHSHSSVVTQYGFRDLKNRKDANPFVSLNPYHLGWNMCEDIRRIATEPTDEDRQWFPTWAGKGDWRSVLLDAWANYRDDSFILQYLSPRLVRKMGLFSLRPDEEAYTIEHTQRLEDFREIRQALSENYEYIRMYPDIQITGCNMKGDRRLTLTHTKVDGQELEPESAAAVRQYIELLWGYPVDLVG